MTIDNQTPRAIKVVSTGGQATVAAGSEPVVVTFAADADIGIEVKAWWLDEPRQLCQIFTPWGRTVVVTGKTVLRCLSH